MLSVYAKSNLDMEEVVGAMPSRYEVYVVEKWTEEKTYKVETRGKMVTKNSTSYHGLLLVSEESIVPLQTYVSLYFNRNVYPRDFEDETSIYVQMKPQEKEEVTRLLRLFSKVSGEKMPKYIPKNGFGFYQFESSNLIPVILGMLRSYPGLEEVRLNYAKKQQKHQ